MRVNFAFTSLFTNRVVVRSSVVTVMLAILFVASSFTESSDRDIRSKHVNILIRQIGHQLLLQAGDFTSRVLPVTEIKEGTFLLRFEKEFVFSHDSLIALSQRWFPKTLFPSGYTVTVHECMNAGIVYGFQVSNTSRDILACTGRHQPSGCYTIEFTFRDFYANAELEKAEPGKAELKKTEQGNVDQKTDIDRLTEELRSFNVDPRATDPKPEEFKTTTFDYTTTSAYPVINLVGSGMLVLVSVALLIRHFRKGWVPAQSLDRSIIKESVPEFAALGKFLFDVKGQRLLLGSEVISLTDKECKILELLNDNFGELIPRETLMEKVWINEGVITGRSLDMFVSKLRKKLSSDPELRIANVHGKGYKLEIPETQIL